MPFSSQSNIVKSLDVKNIVKLTQQEYDAIQVYDDFTLYIIIAV